jgi:hypothetical protein
MGVSSFFLDDRVNLVAGLIVLALFGAGAVALVLRQGVAGIFLLLGGFVVLMGLEYRHVHGSG